MEGEGRGVGPQPRRVREQLVGAVGVLGVGDRRVRHEVGRGVGPAVLQAAMPERPVEQPPDLPGAVLADVVVLVEAALQPLADRRAVRGRELVSAGLHQHAEACPRRATVVVDRYDVLHDRVVEQAAEGRAVLPVGEAGAEAARVQAGGAGLALVDAADEDDLAVVGEQVHDLVIQALVEVVAVGVLQVADGEQVLDLAQAQLQRGDPLLPFLGGHDALLVSCPALTQLPCRPPGIRMGIRTVATGSPSMRWAARSSRSVVPVAWRSMSCNT